MDSLKLVAFVFACVGIYFLSFFVVDVEFGKIEEVDSVIYFQGEIVDVLETNFTYVLSVMQPVSVVVFKDGREFTNGSYVGIKGRVTEYKGKKQLLALKTTLI